MADHRKTQTPPPTITFNNSHNSTSDEDQPSNNRRRNKKPRGRPYGSKNKPKPPIIITRESPNTLITHFLEIPPNHDIIQTLTHFTHTRQRALCILNATGSVSNITLRQPPPPHSPKPSSASVLNFPGKFEILSMSGAFLPPPAPPPASGMSVFLSSGQGRVLGGKVVGPLMTAGVVVVTASSFANSLYQRLPLVEDDEVVEEDNDKVNLTVPGTGEKIQTLIQTNAATAGLFHGLGNNAQNEEFWSGRLPF